MTTSASTASLCGRSSSPQTDAPITGVGSILFWPALFALGGTKQQKAEYGRLSGELDALQQASIEKKCSATPKTEQTASAS